MSISDNYVPVKELGNGSTNTFSGLWQVLNEDYIRVYLENVSTGDQVLQTLGSDYTLTFDDDGFIVDFTIGGTPPPSTEYVVIGREVAEDQTDPYETTKGFQGTVLENSLDKLTAIDQDQSDEIDRSLKFQLGSTSVGELPEPVADYVLAWDGITGKLKNGATITDVANAATNAATASAAAISASADAIAAAASAASAAASANPTAQRVSLFKTLI